MVCHDLASIARALRDPSTIRCAHVGEDANDDGGWYSKDVTGRYEFPAVVRIARLSTPRRADAREARDVRAVPRRRARSAVRDEDAMRRVSDARPVRGARREREPSQPRDANRRDDRADVPVLRNAAAALPASGRRRRRRREDETYKHNRGAPSRRGDVSSRASVRARRRRAARGSAPRAAARLCRRGVHRECLGPDLAPMPQRRDGAAVDPSRGWRRRREGGGARARRIRRRRARRRSVRARIFASSGRAAERAATSGARVVDGRRRLGAVRSFAFR